VFSKVDQYKIHELIALMPEILQRLDALEADKVSGQDLAFFHGLKDQVVRDKANGRKNAG